MAAYTIFSQGNGLDLLSRHRAYEPDLDHEIKSLHLFRILDFLGYSEKMVNYRKHAYQERDNIYNASDEESSFHTVTCGSKGEGLAKPFQSDTDILFINKRIICTEGGNQCQIPRSLTVLTFNPQYEHPGYSLLSLERHGTSQLLEVHQNIHRTDSGQQIVSSDKYITAINNALQSDSSELPERLRSGPALSMRIGGIEDVDEVPCLPSNSPTVLYRWMTRPRQYDWPPEDLRIRLVQMDGNFVAKGCKESEMTQHEWRQCFNEIELLLLHSLKPTHRKLYALLKIVLKDILRSLDRHKAITSYCMKNIVFWLAERYPMASFEPKDLIKWMIRALVMLRHSIASLFLPYYMIPERNVLGCMTKKTKKDLLLCIHRMIRAGPRLLFKCKKLTFTEEMTYGELYAFSEKRDDLETVFLSLRNRHDALANQGLTLAQIKGDETYRALGHRMCELAYSDWPPHLQEKFEYCDDHYERLAVILH